VSVNTTADDHRDEAVENVKRAISSLSEIVIEQCAGHDDWKDEYRATLKKSLLGLIEIRDAL
jgi:hypothetical protein